MRCVLLSTVLVFFLLVVGNVDAVKILDERIKHIVVLMEENRSFDHLLGWYNKTKVNGLTGKEFNRVNVSDPTSEKIYVTKGSPYINYCDPNHATPATTYKVFGPSATKDHNLTLPKMDGFVMFEDIFDKSGNDHYCGVMSMFDTEEQLPVVTKLAEEFLVMDHMFASVPGPTWPNRQFFMSATSSGLTETFMWHKNRTGELYPQKTIFDQVAERNASWAVYYQDTPWEMFMETIAHNPEHLHSMDQFYEDAKTGNLPAFSFLNPRSGINVTTGEGSNDEHPDHDVALAEAHYKSVYEALRNGAAWNNTLFVLTYDEHGGFYDHVPTPLNAGIPKPGQKSYPDKFDFDRLGVRLPTLLISPWIAKGSVLGRPPAAQKPANNSEYDLTSIMASARNILKPLHDLPPLTGRDAWVATWEHVLMELDEPRTDCPETLPLPPAPTITPQVEAAQVINGLQSEVMQFHANLVNEPMPKHIRLQGDLSEWLQSKYQEHRATTMAWKATKSTAGGESATVPVPTLGIAPFHVETLVKHLPNPTQQWLLSKSFGGPKNAPHSRRMTFSTLFNGTDFCLDGAGMKNGSVLTVSKCYPTADPRLNRDKDQQWTLHHDATLRPYRNSKLCATNRFFQTNETDSRIYLAPCDEGDVRQHYAYHGKGGNGMPGLLVYGDGLTMFTLF